MNARLHVLETLAAGLAGALFGAGLLVSGMAQPSKVLAFLDVAGAWDPSLALVMGGAVAVGLVGFHDRGKRELSALGLPMRLPTSRDVDARLLVGAAAFGIGWGIAGLCPGPALVALASGSGDAWLFAASMLAGMGLFEVAARPG